MRIIWNQNESRFEAELVRNETWRDTIELIKKAGFKTDGPPGWAWHTVKASVLNKLRDLKPATGVSITEVALEKYKQIDQQEKKKLELKKLLKTARKAADKSHADSLVVEDENGVVVEPLKLQFIPTYIRPEPPAESCFICGDPIYFYEYPDMCLWCSKN
jgi:hypothetical protein